MRPTESEIREAGTRLAGSPPDAVLAWGLERFRGRIAVASSFSLEDCVVIDMAHAIDPAVRVFALDTGRLPEETYQTADRVREKYRVAIEWQFPARERVEALERDKGLYSFMESLDNRHECCGIRKVEPLARALADLDGWVTGLRREQSVTRTDAGEVELDAGHGGLAKLNPLIGWTEAQLWTYANQRRVPVHPLHKRGYPSIGCAPCTRAVKPGEHPRAGRWWWENPESKECGLHPVKE
jgi:phosphoadenosine phosphosulfate reductase